MTGESVAPPLEAIKIIVQIALDEDAAKHDRTTHLLPESTLINAVIVARNRTVICGLDCLVPAFGSSVRVGQLVSDGDMVAAGTELASLKGSARAILSAERTVLNLLGRLSGIATLTRRYVDKLDSESQTRILDTRKTTPGLRMLEKYAVRCGGGHNHRMSLVETIFVKDNHIAAAGGLDKLMKNHTGVSGEILIIEADTLEGVKAALKHSPTRILLDNMDDDQVAAAQKLVKDRCEVEVSGNVTLERVARLSKLGVDCISIGALTHSAPVADLSLEIVK